MEKHPLVFIAFEEYDNLGVGYMAALLSREGFDVRVVNFMYKKDDILKILKRLDPLLVGFSVIFQYHIDHFRELIVYLRKGGIRCHFTAGGQYASLRFNDLFEFIPELDSIVRFEGEYTLLELAKCISSGEDWRKTESVAYTKESQIITNPLRPLEDDLDNFPFPLRTPLRNYAFEKKFATILAGRGCVHNCSFCNIREFYRQHEVPKKRIRKPEMVVKEMEALYNEKNCSVFLFQDDDFPVKTDKGQEWIERFCSELKIKGLSDKIMWKINCRPDEIEEKIFTMMKSNGMYLVFLGIEDGTDQGLKRLNKNMTASKSLEGINILKRLGIDFDYGFMLFQPLTTYSSLNENLDFLRLICYDGYTPVTFLKTLPFFETLIEKELKDEGRLKGKPGFWDYDFLEESMNHYYDFTADCFKFWLRDKNGLLNISKWARNFFLVYSRYFESTSEAPVLYRNIREIVSESNLFLLDTMKELAVAFKSEHFKDDKTSNLKSCKERIDQKHNDFREQIKNTIVKLLRLAEVHQV